MPPDAGYEGSGDGTFQVSLKAKEDDSEFIWVLSDIIWIYVPWCSGNIWGDPHVTKWDGEGYDWHGECDNVYLHAPEFGDGLGLDIHTRSKVRHDYSFIESAAVRIGNDILEVGSYGEYMLNGVHQAQLPEEISGYTVSHDAGSDPNVKKSSFVIDIAPGNAITIRTVKDIVSVSIGNDDGPMGKEMVDWFGNSTGLLGSFFGGKMLARDGETIIGEAQKFGQEWQVNDSDPKLFQNQDRPPQYPETCVLPSTGGATEEKRRLGGGSVSLASAREACSGWPEEMISNCIQDVVATGDLDLARNGKGKDATGSMSREKAEWMS